MERRLAVRVDAAVGRERELETLRRSHAEARANHAPAFVLLKGPPGIGKTHLLAALGRALSADGVAVIEAGARRSGAGPLSLIRQLIPRWFELAEERRVDAAELASLASRLAPLAGDRVGIAGLCPTRRPEESRLDAADALADLMVRSLGGTPAILLDDLDAADRGSLELLQYLTAVLQAPGHRQGFLLVGTFRDGHGQPALQSLLERLPALSLPLAPLDLEGIRRLLGRPEVAERIFEATAGDPSRLEAVLAPAPPLLHAHRLRRLDEDARRLLSAAAILEHPATAGLLEAVAGPAAAACIQRLAAEGFLSLEMSGVSPTWCLTRESDREELRSAKTGPAKSLHLAAARALEAAGAPAEEIARHLLVVDPFGEGAIWAGKAAEALSARYAFDAAIPFYRAALAFRDAPARELHLGLSAAHEANGEMLAALRHLGFARRGGDVVHMREARSEAARLCVRIGKLPQAERLCKRVLGGSSFDPDEPAMVRAYVDLCEIRFLLGDYEGAAEACTRGMAQAEGLPEARIAMRNTLGRISLTRGDYEEALDCFRRNAAEAEALGLQREQMRGLVNQGAVHHRQGQRPKAIECYKASLALGWDRTLVALGLGNLAALYHESGDFEMALEHYGSALAAFTLLRRIEGISHAGINRARLLLFLGRLPEAEDGVRLALREASSLGNPNLVLQAKLVLGEILLARGLWSEALAALTPLPRAFAGLGNRRYEIEASIMEIRARMGLGAFEDAAAALGGLEERADSLGGTDLAVEVALVTAEVELGAGRKQAALERLQEGRRLLLSRAGGVGGDTDLEAGWRLYALLAEAADAAGQSSAAHRLRARVLLDELLGKVPSRKLEGFLAIRPRARQLLDWVEDEIAPGRRQGIAWATQTPAGVNQAIVGTAPALMQVLRMVEPVGRSMVPVLLRGESGTGKERIAEAIHLASPRGHLPLVRVNCAAMHEELLLSELFGHEKGAFTGAVRERKGRFELADGGSLFLDEVAELSPRAQVALLRVLQEKSFERVGGSRTLTVDVRLICATNRNLEEMISRGRFRDDLYYRLKGVMLELPPLRERRTDIPELASHFLSRVCVERGLPDMQFSSAALALLSEWHWPGNVRELENVIHSVSIFAEGSVVGSSAFESHMEFLRTVRSGGGFQAQNELPSNHAFNHEQEADAGIDYYAVAQSRGIGVRELQQELELQMISRALSEAKGNISEAARLLQMKRSRLSQIVNGEPQLLAVAKGAA